MTRLLFSVLAFTIVAASAASAQEQTPQPASTTGHWEIVTNSSPLTGARTMAASVESSNELANMLGYAARASLIIRCGESGLAVYVSWPQVVTRDGQNMMGQPKTMASWRIDSEKIKVNLWDVDTTGTAAGEFRHMNALKLLTSLVGARTLVVRLIGRQTQNAAFDLTGIDKVAADVSGACSVNLRG